MSDPSQPSSCRSLSFGKIKLSSVILCPPTVCNSASFINVAPFAKIFLEDII